MDYSALTELCRGRKVWIQTHNFPDPDAVASAFGLSEFLKNFGIETRLCHDGEIDKLSTTKMLHLIGADMKAASEIGDMKEDDMIILVDCQKNAGNTTDFIGDEVAVIDHHPTFKEAEYKYKDLRMVGSCSSIITDYFRAADIKPSEIAATALLYGLRMDTLQFSRGVTAFDIEAFSYLFPLANQELLTELETNNMEFQDLHGYGVAIDNVKVYGLTAFSYLDFACPDALVSILSDFILSLAEVELVILYARRNNGYKFSFRSEREGVDAGRLANLGLADWGNGGGHPSMAGGFVPEGKLPEDAGLRYAAVQERFTKIIGELYPEMLKDE